MSAPDIAWQMRGTIARMSGTLARVNGTMARMHGTIARMQLPLRCARLGWPRPACPRSQTRVILSLSLARSRSGIAQRAMTMPTHGAHALQRQTTSSG
eukprot:3872064-Rhodomonas_salina.3